MKEEKDTKKDTTKPVNKYTNFIPKIDEGKLRDQITDELKNGFTKSYGLISGHVTDVFSSEMTAVVTDIKQVSEASLNFVKSGLAGTALLTKKLFGMKEETKDDKILDNSQKTVNVLTETKKEKKKTDDKQTGIFTKQHRELQTIVTLLGGQSDTTQTIVSALSPISILTTEQQRANREQKKANKEDQLERARRRKEQLRTPKTSAWDKFFGKLSPMIDALLLGIGAAIGGLVGVVTLPFVALKQFFILKFILLSKIVKGFVFSLEKSLPWITKTLTKGIEMLVPFGKRITSTIKSMFSIFDKITDSIKFGLFSAQYFFASKFPKTFALFDKITDSVKSGLGFIKNIFNSTGPFISGFKLVFGKIMKFAGPIGIALNILDGILGFINGFNKTEGSLFEKIIGGLTGGILKILDFPIRIIGWVFDKIKSFFGMDTSTKTADQVIAILELIPTMIIDSVKFLYNKTKELFSGGIITGVVNTIGLLIKGYLTLPIQAIGFIVDTVKGWFGMDTTTSFADTLYGYIDSFTSFIGTWLKESFEEVGKFFKDNPIVQKIKDTISEYWDLFKQGVTDILKSLVSFLPGGDSIVKKYEEKMKRNEKIEESKKKEEEKKPPILKAEIKTEKTTIESKDKPEDKDFWKSILGFNLKDSDIGNFGGTTAPKWFVDGKFAGNMGYAKNQPSAKVEKGDIMYRGAAIDRGSNIDEVKAYIDSKYPGTGDIPVPTSKNVPSPSNIVDNISTTSDVDAEKERQKILQIDKELQDARNLKKERGNTSKNTTIINNQSSSSNAGFTQNDLPDEIQDTNIWQYNMSA